MIDVNFPHKQLALFDAKKFSNPQLTLFDVEAFRTPCPPSQRKRRKSKKKTQSPARTRAKEIELLVKEFSLFH